jgi:hypothetical protein
MILVVLHNRDLIGILAGQAALQQIRNLKVVLGQCT